MPQLTTTQSLLLQSTLLIILILIQAFFYKGKHIKNFNNKSLFMTLPISLLIFFSYGTNIINLLTIYIMTLTLTVMYLGLKDTFIIYIFIVFANLFFFSNQFLIFYYLFIILFTYVSLLCIKNYYIKLFLVYFYSFIFLNGELYLTQSNMNQYLIYNIFSFFSWTILVHLTIYFHKINIKLRVEQQSMFIDSQTNVKNYCCLLNQSYRLLKNQNAEISLIIINVDRLKDINTLYGTSCGDHAIKVVVNSIKENVKGYGTVYRLDGDSFCVIAINEKFKMMQTISESIRLSVVAKDLIIDNNKINLSVSIGGYHGKIESKNIDDYIEVAHESLIKSKYNGRNRVILNNQMVYYSNIL